MAFLNPRTPFDKIEKSPALALGIRDLFCHLSAWDSLPQFKLEWLRREKELWIKLNPKPDNCHQQDEISPAFHGKDSFAYSTPLKRRARASRATISSISCSSNPRSSTPRSNRPASGSKRPAAISAIRAAARDGGTLTPLSKRS
jgi:hypothetical protein